jgi:hypothetical protein
MMKKAVLIAALAIITAGFAGCEKNNTGKKTQSPPAETGTVPLYDQQKMVTAYIDYDDDATIYLWTEGYPVAYLYESALYKYEDNTKQVYGFNGQLVGWYNDGVLYDKEGYPVGARKGVVRGVVDMTDPMTSPKGGEYAIPARHVQHVSTGKPEWRDQWSEIPFKELLESGRVVYP